MRRPGDFEGPLDREAIASRIPHRGRMALLEVLDGWTDDEIHCRASNHRDPEHPLRSRRGLLATAAIEYAAQAMALHGSLCAADGGAPRPGYLASVRNVVLHRLRLDDVAGDLHIRAHRLAGDGGQIAYQFTVSDGGGELLAEGRATVVLNQPLSEAS